MIDLEFIQRCQSKEFQEVVKEHHQESCLKQKIWRQNNPEKFRNSLKKYSKKEKGKVSSKRRNAINQSRLKHLIKDLTFQEKEEIRSFYSNTPEGYHVDHIIPLCKGGDHHIDNLQYLTAKQNMYKGRSIYWFYQSKYKKKEKHLILYSIYVKAVFYL